MTRLEKFILGIFFLWIAVGLLLAGFANGTPIPAHQLKGQIVIDDDYGGNVSTYVKWYTRLADAGVPVRFRGMCISACTLGLALPKEQMCVESTATFGFHMASSDGVPDPDSTAAIILRYYPPQIQKWLADKKLTTERVVFLNANQIVTWGVMPFCVESLKDKGE